jgi:glutaredoxin
MAPINLQGEAVEKLMQDFLQNKVAVFSKSGCPYCQNVKDILNELGVDYKVLELDQMENGGAIQDSLLGKNGIRSVPQIYIDGKFVGDSSKIRSLKESGELENMLGLGHEYDYDLVVIGGGSGGLSCSREAASLGKKVAVLDYVKPSPAGTKWGLGGTCVNVGCIPKKLFHQAALHHQNAIDMPSFGWTIGKPLMDWGVLVQGIQDHIGSLNWGYRVALREEKVEYINAVGSLVDAHTVKCTTFDRKTGGVKEEKLITAKNVLVATGGRPKYLGLPNDKELCITSDDMFSLQEPPGKTLVVGASYVALECAGFLTELGFDTTVMARSIFLRGFDQQMAEKIVDYMANHGTKFIRPSVPESLEKVGDQVKVTWKEDGVQKSDVFDTVLLAVGRDAQLESVKDVGLATKNGKLVVDQAEATNIEGVYALGDVLYGKPELTPVAIHAGKLLAKRLFKGSKELCDYDNIPTTVFTPLEYGCIGLTEEDAIAKYGDEDIEVYHAAFKPLEWTVPHREDNACYTKLICVISQGEKVVGFHYIGPNAGEVTQGYAVGMRMGATKHDFESTIGIHPTTSEEVIKVSKTKRSGADPNTTGC